MSKYLRQVIATVPFDGDTVKVSLRPIAFEHQMEIEDLIPETPPKNVNLEEWRQRRFPVAGQFETWQAEQTKLGQEMWNRLRVLLTEYITSVEGLNDAAGTAIGKEEMLRDAYFIGLIQQVFKAWWEARAPARPVKPTSPSAEGSSTSSQSPTNETGATVG